MRRCFVVLGRVGEYSGATEWCVRVFLSEERARTFARDCFEHAMRLFSDESFYDRRVWANGGPTEADLDQLSWYDPTLVYTIKSGPCAGQRAINTLVAYQTSAPIYTVVACDLEEAG